MSRSPAHQTGRGAIVIGGSMSGLFTAAFLKKIGWRVDVYERSRTELVGRGAGITGHPELFQVLVDCGAGLGGLGVEVPKRIAIDRAGSVTEERPLRQILTSRDRLQRLLRTTIDERNYHLGWNFENVEQDERGVRVTFSGDRVEESGHRCGGRRHPFERAPAFVGHMNHVGPGQLEQLAGEMNRAADA